MYEDQTFSAIEREMLNQISNDIDKRVGSIIYDATAPAALEFEKVYQALDTILNESNPLTASRDSLIRHAKAFQITPIPATHAVLKAVMIMDSPTNSVPIGTRFSKGDLNYVVTEYLGNNRYYVQCEQAGEIGNTAIGLIQPIYHINGLRRAEIVGLAIPGTDVEGTEHLRKRFQDKFGEQPFGGNMADYKLKIGNLQGVGGCKMIRHFEDKDWWVGVIIIDTTWHTPSEELLEQLQEQIHPILPEYSQPVIENSGDGITPIGHIAIVKGVKEVKINVGLHLTFDNAHNWQDLEQKIKEEIENYLLISGAQKWADSDRLTVRISGIENVVLGIDGVIDIQNTELNSEQNNIVLNPDEIPVIGTVING